MSDEVYPAGAKIETNHKSSGTGGGTLGGFARDKAGNPVLVTCSHVLFPGFKVTPDLRVYSPGYSSCLFGGDPIGVPVFNQEQPASPDGAGGWVGGFHDGTWTGGFNAPEEIPSDAPANASEVDCAIARLDSGIQFHNEWRIDTAGGTKKIPIRGAVTKGLGVIAGPGWGYLPTEQQYVRMYSANWGGVLRWGTVLSWGLNKELLYHSPIFDPKTDRAAGVKPSINQFLILPRPVPIPGQTLEQLYENGEELTLEQGESGSWVINSDNRVVAMITRGFDGAFDRSRLETKHAQKLWVATPIGAILNHLGITVPESENGFTNAKPAAATSRVYAVTRAGRGQERVQVLRGELLHSTRGRLLLGKIAQHGPEVRSLLTTVRPIATTWRDLQGPRFLHHYVRCLEQPSHRVPDTINGVTRRRLMDVMVPLFLRHAGPQLRSDIERYGPTMVEALLPVAGLADVPAALASPGGRHG
jgi:hypothetical protein